MIRRLLVVLAAGGAFTLTACGAAPTTASAPESTATSAEAGGSATGADHSSTSLDALQAKADAVLEELFVADRDVDYPSIRSLTSRAVAARYRNQELLASIDGLDDRLKATAMESVTVTSDIEVLEPSRDAVATTGAVTATYTDDDGVESEYTYRDVVFEMDDDDLLVADWRTEPATMPASALFLDTADVEPSTVGDVTVTLEPGYRDPEADPAFVEYLFSVTNDAELVYDVVDAELMTPDNELYDIQFGVADTIRPGTTGAARVGFEGPSVPVSGGTLTVTLEDETGDRALVMLDVPAFVDEDGDPEPVRAIELADVAFSTSGTLAADEPTTASTAEAADLEEITDAAAFRDSLLAIARADHDPDAPEDGWGIPDAWVAAVPGLQLVGFQIEASPTSVSGFAITGDKAGTSEGLPFAVMDSSGRCAGGVVLGEDGEPSEFVAVDLSDATTCNASAVIDATGLS